MSPRDETPAQDQLQMLVSRVRESATSLLERLAELQEEVDAAAPVSDADARGAALHKAVTRFHTAVDSKELDHQRRALRQLLTDEPELCDYGNDAWAIADGLPDLAGHWPPLESPPNAAAIAAGIKKSTTTLNELVFHCSMITVPGEVARELESLRIGKSLSFHTSFKSVLPDAQHRQDLLTKLKHSRICGWVDTPTGLIYRLPRTTWGRLASCLAPVVAAISVGTGLYLLGTLNLPDDLSALDDGGQLLGTYALVLAGALFHLAVENVREERNQPVPILSISDGVYWLSLRWPALVKTLVPIVIVTIGLRAEIDPEGSEHLLYFFAGYSLDSVVGLMLTRFGNAASAAATSLQERLGPAQGSGATASGGSASAPTAAATTPA